MSGLRIASAQLPTYLFFPTVFAVTGYCFFNKEKCPVPVPLAHIPVLAIGTVITVASIPAYFNTAHAIRMFGLPERIATSPTAYSPFVLYTSRIQAIAVMLLIFYAKAQYEAVDTVLALMGFFGLVDFWVCWQEGVKGKAVFRLIAGGAICAMGYFGITAVGIA